MKLKQIGWRLRLTEQTRTELSDILYETGEVTAKNRRIEDSYVMLGFADGAMTLPLNEDKGYHISFRGQRTSFDLDDKAIFRAFEVGNKVRIAYRERYRETYDYVPPDFNAKKLVYRVMSGFKLVSVQKIG